MHGNRKRAAGHTWGSHNRNKRPGGAGPGSNVKENEWEEKPRGERHEGSYPLEEIHASEAYSRRITQENALKRKYALCFSYLGSNYQGLQINPGAKTVEAELERALFLAGGIIEQNYGYMQKIQWTRAARTDRGVHAITQCCAMKLLFNPNDRAGFISNVNSFLPSDIRVQALTKVAKSFNAKNFCSKRSYHYLLPTYVLQDIAVVNGELQTAFDKQGPVVGAGYEGGFVEPSCDKLLGRANLCECRNKFISYRISVDSLQKLRSALKLYEGTNSYHNFTSGKDSSEVSAKRFIISFTCGEPFVAKDTGVEWVLLEVIGQSFLLNQIRKMVGFAIEVARGGASAEQLQAAFGDKRVDVPMAPSLGLYLNELFYDGYNNKQQQETERDKFKTQSTKVSKEDARDEEGRDDEKNDDGDDQVNLFVFQTSIIICNV